MALREHRIGRKEKRKDDGIAHQEEPEAERAVGQHIALFRVDRVACVAHAAASLLASIMATCSAVSTSGPRRSKTRSTTTARTAAAASAASHQICHTMAKPKAKALVPMITAGRRVARKRDGAIGGRRALRRSGLLGIEVRRRPVTSGSSAKL